MPFTFAHPAAALPLRRVLGRQGVLSALAIGAMAPDMAFFVPVDAPRALTHGVAGLFLFCLPAGALAYLLFHGLLKQPLLGLFPDGLRARLSAVAGPARAPLSAVVISLLCGALTHIAWDAFTHPGTVVVDAIPALQALLFSAGGYRVYTYKLLQHASSIAGLGLLAFWLHAWLRSAVPVQPSAEVLPPGSRWIALAAITGLPLLFAVWAGVQRSQEAGGMVTLQAFAAGFVFAALPALAASITAYSIWWRIYSSFRVWER